MRVALFCLVVLSLVGCRRWFHKECRSGYPVNSGEIIYGLAYNCLVFNPDDKGDTLAVTRAGQWDSLWAAIQAKYNGDCPKPNIDFNTNSVLALYTQFHPSDKTIRNVVFDHSNKKVIYTVTTVNCKNTLMKTEVLGFGYNYVVTNKLPVGYSIVYKTETQ